MASGTVGALSRIVKEHAPSLYEDLIGAAFVRLPKAVRVFHALSGRHVFQGQVRTSAPASFAARLCSRCVGAPLRRAEGPLRFELEADREHEIWRRHFPDRTMTSRLSRHGNHLVERLGVLRLFFEPRASAEGLDLRLVRVDVFGIPCPRLLLPRIVARESGQDDRLHFDVEVTLPLIGSIARYSGHVDLADEAAA